MVASPPLRLARDLRRHGRSLWRFWSTSLASELEYPLNAWIELVAVLGNLAGSLFVLQLLFSGRPSLGGWSWNGALVVLGLYTLLDGFTTCLLQPNLSRIVSHVQNGTLDYVLLKPIDSQFWLSTRTVSPWGLPAVLAGIALVAWALVHPEPGAAAPPATAALSGWGALLLPLVLLLSAAVILYSLWFVLAALSIWFVKVWNATEVLRYTLVAGRYPVSAYPPALRLLFTFVLPVAFLTTVPAEALLGRGSVLWMGASLLVAVLCFAGSRLLWVHAQRFYTSASS
jgi:ABC-2 type transport system permease protein